MAVSSSVTVIVALISAAAVLVIFGFGLYQTSNSMSQISSSSVCLDIIVPYKVTYGYAHSSISGTCGWSKSNTIYRSIVTWVAAASCVVVVGAIARGSAHVLWMANMAVFASAATMISVMTLDANSIRVGVDYCRSLYYANDDTVSVTCSATTFSLLALGDGLAVVVLYATSVLGKRCVLAAADAAAPTS